MGRSYGACYDIGLHAVERYMERVLGERAPSDVDQERVDALRRVIQRDLRAANELHPAGWLALSKHGMIEPDCKAMISGRNVYVVRGKKVMTMIVADDATLALAEELVEQAATRSGVFRTNAGYIPDESVFEPLSGAVAGLDVALTVPRNLLRQLVEEWECFPHHANFLPQLSRLRRKARPVRPEEFRQGAKVDPGQGWSCYRYKFFWLAVDAGRMVACVVA